MSENIYGRLQAGFSGALEKPCLVRPNGDQYTYAQIDDLSARFCAELLSLGVRPGDRVVVQVDKSVGNVALYLGVLRVGATFVPLNTAYTANEVAYFLENASPSLVVCRPGDKAEIDKVILGLGTGKVVTMSSEATSGLWRDAAKREPNREIAKRQAGDVAAIIYTSGTTGRSKGAMLTHGNLYSNAKALHDLWEISPEDTLIHALPIFHVHGLFFALHTSFLSGIPIHFLDGYDAELIRGLLPKSTLLMGVPTFYSRLLALPGFGVKDCASMRLFVSGSAPLTAQASDAWTDATGHRILERYGMSEAGVIASNPYNGDRVAGSVGFAMPGSDVIVADETGRELPRGEVGVVEARGPNIFKGYWGMPEKTAEEYRENGFFITGDNGVMDKDGRLSIVGRAKDLIISGGFNIYPKEIEQVLDDIDGVAESAVVGVPHGDLGEGVIAILVGDKDNVGNDVVRAAMDASLARFKHPRRIYWLDALPRNTMGKVQKVVLREQYKHAYQ